MFLLFIMQIIAFNVAPWETTNETPFWEKVKIKNKSKFYRYHLSPKTPTPSLLHKGNEMAFLIVPDLSFLLGYYIEKALENVFCNLRLILWALEEVLNEMLLYITEELAFFAVAKLLDTVAKGIYWELVKHWCSFLKSHLKQMVSLKPSSLVSCVVF